MMDTTWKAPDKSFPDGSTIPGAFAPRLLGILVAIIACLAMAGCAFAPGQDVSLNVRGESPDSHYVKLIPITPQLLAANENPGSANGVPAALLDYHPEAYRIGPGDLLYITVWDHPELTSPAGNQQQAAANGRLVRPDGTIYYPFAGTVQAAGKTIEQLRQLLADKLATYIRKPEVDISVIDYGSQHVLVEGALTKTGPQPITTVPLTLGEALGSAVVDTNNANLSDVMLARDGQVYHINMDRLEESGKIAKDIYLKAGDRIVVPYNDRQEVYVMGEVVRPAALKFKTADLTLTQAIGQAGGLNQLTSKGKIYVIRDATSHGPGQPGAKVYELDAKSPVAFALADQFRVKPGDVVFASAAGITRWNRFLTQLLPLTSAISATAASSYYFNHP
jgi:polysaccharide biosynthesis/export protein